MRTFALHPRGGPSPGRRLFCLWLAGLFLTFRPAFAAEETLPLPPLPQAATSFGATLSAGYVYVYGGNTGKAHEFNRECVRGEFFRLKMPAANEATPVEWEKLPGGLGLLSSALVTHGTRVIRIGGLNARNEPGAKNDLISTNEVMSYDPAAQKWEALPPLPEPRSSHDAVVVGDILYVAGGWRLGGIEGSTRGEWCQTMLSLDLGHPEQGWKSQPQPFQRRALAMTAQGGKLWFLGGMDSHDDTSRAVDWFDLQAGQWGQGPEIPDGPMEGFGMACCTAGNRVLISPLSGQVSALSADGAQWETIAALTPARFFHRLMVLADDVLLPVGGSGKKGHVLTLKTVKLDEAAKAAALAEPKTPEPAPVAPPVTTGTAKDKSAALGEWPQWRGPARDGLSPETGWRKAWPAAGPKRLWQAQVGVGLGSCVVSGGLVFVQGNDGQGTDTVFAFDAASGAEKWRYAYPCQTAAHEMPMVPDGPGATPTVAAGRLYVLSREGDLLCLAAESGQLAWRKALVADLGGKRPVYGYTQSPLLAGGKLFLDLGAAKDATGSTAALDSATGEVLWKAGTGEAGYSSARLLEREGHSYVAMFKGEALDVFDPADGRVLWSYRMTARDFANALTPVFVGHQVLVSNTGEPFAKLLDWDAGAAANVHEVWSNQQFALLFNNPILWRDHLFAFNEKRRGVVQFSCLDARSGVTKWVSDAVPTGTFILADGQWIFLTREGEVVLAEASLTGLAPSARFKAVEGKCYATPALSGGRLFVRSNAGEVAAFDLNGG